MTCPFFSTGVISLSRSLHGKANTVISMVISAEDGGGLTAPANARVNVSVVGGSVASPVFEQAQYFFTVSEDVLRGTAVGVVRAASKTGDDINIEVFPLYCLSALTLVTTGMLLIHPIVNLCYVTNLFLSF